MYGLEKENLAEMGGEQEARSLGLKQGCGSSLRGPLPGGERSSGRHPSSVAGIPSEKARSLWGRGDPCGTKALT